MNERTTYELTINEKLQHLPLPAMEDAIWARVKAQLDIDLPSNDGGSGGPDAPSGSGWFWGAGTFLFVAALVAVFLYFKKPTQQPSTTTSIPAPTTPFTTPATPQPADSGKALPNQRFSPAPELNPGSAPVVLANPTTDSMAVVPEARLPEADPQQTVTVLQPPPVVADTARPKAKTKGVKGLTDDDYRIVPAKKDSL